MFGMASYSRSPGTERETGRGGRGEGFNRSWHSITRETGVEGGGGREGESSDQREAVSCSE